MSGRYIVNVGVGALPSAKAKLYVADVQRAFKDAGMIKDGESWVFIANRDSGRTTVEAIWTGN